MRYLIGLVLLSCSAAALAAPPAASHPLIGTWTTNAPDGKCPESYVFRVDGTSTISSGKEVSDFTYEVAATEEKGFYKFSNKVIKNNGQKDCGGESLKVGDTDNLYVQFDPKKEMFIMCQTASLEKCFGPLRKAK